MDYYPFELSIDRNQPVQTPAMKSAVDRYLYNGKELEDETGFVDYGARMYSPEIGRWGVVDPLSEVSRRFSPYVYANDNSLRFINPDGMRVTQNGNWESYDEGDARKAFEEEQRASEERNKKEGRNKNKQQNPGDLNNGYIDKDGGPSDGCFNVNVRRRERNL